MMGKTKQHFEHLKFSAIFLPIGIASLFSDLIVVDVLGGMILGSGLAFLFTGIVMWRAAIRKEKELLEKGADAL